MSFLSNISGFKKRRKESSNYNEIDPSNFYLVSFPKSGNTWVRFLLANLLCQQNSVVDFKQLCHYVPDIGRETDKKIIMDSNSSFQKLPQQFVKTHATYSPIFRKIIYIVRDGRDALTSYYYWINARVDHPVSLNDLIRANVPPSIPGGLWSNHVLGWLEGKCERKLIVRYEDLIENPERELEKIAKFSELNVNLKQIKLAVKASSFSSLHRIEENKGVFDGQTPAIKKVPFIRKGIVGDWKNLFSNKEHELFWEYHAKAMNYLKYKY